METEKINIEEYARELFKTLVDESSTLYNRAYDFSQLSEDSKENLRIQAREICKTLDLEFYEDIRPEITDEMRIYSNTRTRNHIHLVQMFGQFLGYDFSAHDHTKFSEDLNDLYVLIDNSYRTDAGITPVEYTEAMAVASFTHIKAEQHHPEYWDPSITQMNPNIDRDSPDVTTPVDASKMTPMAIAEMCCDWCAMSYELNSDPLEWAEKNVGSRWIFTTAQTFLIDAYLAILWERKDEIHLLEEYEELLRGQVIHGRISTNEYRAGVGKVHLNSFTPKALTDAVKRIL